MSVEIDERDQLTRGAEKREKRSLAALLLLLLRTRPSAPVARRKLVVALAALRSSVAEQTAQALDLPIPALPKRALASASASRLLSAATASVETKPGKILRAIEPLIDRTIRTEVQAAHNDAYVSAHAGKKGAFRWDATLDKRTCPECSALHGRTFPPSATPRCPAHPLCRCLLVFVPDK